MSLPLSPPALSVPSAVAPAADWPPEMEVVALCARPVLAADQTARLNALLGAEMDWTTVLDRARLHGVLGMVYHHLTQQETSAVPPDVTQAMARLSRHMQVRNLQAMQTLTQIAEVFSAADVPLLTFKGPLLAQRYYGNVAFRQFGDVDVLVRRAQLDEAQALLEAHGYRTARDLSDAEIERRHEEQLGLEFTHPHTPVVVELHWALLNRTFSFRLDSEEAWARARSVELGTAQVYSLAPDDLLLYLCAHGAKHHWSRLLCACDVAQVLHAHPSLLGKSLLNKAHRKGSRRILALGLRLTERWLGLVLPAPVRAAVTDDPAVESLVEEIEERWFGTEAGIRPTPSRATLSFTLRTRERWRDNWAMLRHYLRLAVAPTDNDRAFVPGGLFSGSPVAQSLVRPVRLLGKGLSSAVRGLKSISSPSDGSASLLRRARRLGRKVRRRSWGERRDLAVALGTASLVAVLLHTCSFRRVLNLVDRWADGGSTEPLDAAAERRLLWAVQAVSRRLLPRRPCLTQALTARLLLGRRGGRPTELQIGVVRESEGTLGAHAWLERDGSVLTGGAASPHVYAPLADRASSPTAPPEA